MLENCRDKTRIRSQLVGQRFDAVEITNQVGPPYTSTRRYVGI